MVLGSMNWRVRLERGLGIAQAWTGRHPAKKPSLQHLQLGSGADQSHGGVTMRFFICTHFFEGGMAIRDDDCKEVYFFVKWLPKPKI